VPLFGLHYAGLKIVVSSETQNWQQIFTLPEVYFIGFMPRSLHIFLARLSSISECRGTDERLF